MDKMFSEGKIRINERTNKVQYFVEPKSEGDLDTNWTDIAGYAFKTGYPTENSEKLLERVIKAFSNKEDLIVTFLMEVPLQLLLKN